MSFDFTINQGDTLPILSDTLTYSDGTAVNLTGASVAFVMRQQSAASALINSAATVVDPSAGMISYTFTATNSSTPGLFEAAWIVTFADSSVMTFPTEGWMSIEVQPNLLAAGTQQLVSVDDAADILNLTNTDRVHDTKILRWIEAARVVFEQKCGPIVVQNFDEWYDGGQYFIMLRHTPSTALGSNPVCAINFVETYIGPIEYQFTGVGNPVVGSIYTYELDTFSRVVRRGPGGGIIPFPNMLQSVHIGYTAGQETIPANVYEAVLEYLREMYQETAQAGRSGFGNSAPEAAPDPILGFAMSRRVVEILGLSRRGSSVF